MTTPAMPVVFIGHGSPINAIERNKHTAGWQDIAAAIPRPRAIVSISAHWFTQGTRVCPVENPETIHDFYGFPQALYDVRYPAKGDPALAGRILGLLEGTAVADPQWGLDHGTWSVLTVMYPQADIPVLQLSVDYGASPEELYAIGRKLAPLREEGVLILGSGNVVHNLRRLDFSMTGGFDWAEEFDRYIAESIRERQADKVVHYADFGSMDKLATAKLATAKLAVPTPDHFHPLLIVLGAVDDRDTVTVYNQECIAGSLSMTSYRFYKEGE